MRKIIAHLDMNVIGCDEYRAFVFDDSDTEDFIKDILWEAAVEHASHYYEVYSDEDFHGMEEEEMEEVMNSESYMATEDIYYSYEEYDPKKHDGLRPGGGSFENDFTYLLKVFPS